MVPNNNNNNMVPLSRVLITSDIYGDTNRSFRTQRLSMQQTSRSSEFILQNGRVATYLRKFRSDENYAVVSINRFTINVPTLSITYFPHSTADYFTHEQDDETMVLEEKVVVPDAIEVVFLDEPDEEVVVVPDETVEVVEEKDNVVEVGDVVDEDDTADEDEEDEEEEDEEENSYVGGIWGIDDYFPEDGPPEGQIPYYGPRDF